MSALVDPGPRVVPFGDRALLAILGEGVDPILNRRVHVLAAAVRRAAARDEPGWGAAIPGVASLLVPFDPDRLAPERAIERLAGWLAEVLAGDLPDEEAGLILEIPVVYGGSAGPDLGAVAERCGLSETAVAELHASVVYRVLCLGFVPGFAYLGPLPAPLVLPRRPEPRLRVPAGSVAIAGRQTAVYPFATAGGWHLIGATRVRPWDLRRDRPSLLRAGDRVRFVPASSEGPG